MELDYFEVEINGRIHPVKRKEFSPSEGLKGKFGYQIWIWDSNIEAAKFLIKEHEIEFIVTSTLSIDYLKDSAFANIKEIIIHREVTNLSPLKNLKQLKYLQIFNEGQGELNFEWFPNLVEFRGFYSNKYNNLTSLKNLEYLSLTYYRKKNLEEISLFKRLKYLHLARASCQNLNGLGLLEKLEVIDLDYCKRLTSLSGLGQKNIKLKAIKITDCPNLVKASIIENLALKVSITIDGVILKNYVETEEGTEINLGHWIIEETKENSSAIQEIETILNNLKAKLTPQNWRKELIQCIKQINEIDREINLIYTGEWEELVEIIQQIAIEIDPLEVDLIIDEIREW